MLKNTYKGGQYKSFYKDLIARQIGKSFGSIDGARYPRGV